MSGDNFFSRFNSIVDSRVLGDLSAGALRVLMVYLRHADNDTGKAWQSIETTAEKIGEGNKNRVRRSIRELETHGILQTTDAGGGRNRPATRMIMTLERGTHPVPVSDDERGTDSVPVSELERGTDSDLKGDSFEPKGGQIRVQRGTVLCPPNNWNNSKNTTSNTTADGGGDGGVNLNGEKCKCEDALKMVGIHQPQRSQIASIPGMRDFIIRGVWKEIDDEGACQNPKGLFVSRINADPQGLIVEWTGRQAHEVDRRQRQATAGIERERFLREVRDVESVFLKIYEHDPAGVDATIDEIRKSIVQVPEWTETLLECELESRCGDVPSDIGPLADLLSKKAKRAIAASAWKKKTHHDDAWFKEHLVAVPQELQSANA